MEHGIVFPNLTNEEPLRAYSAADYAGDLDTSPGHLPTAYICVSVGCTSGMAIETTTNSDFIDYGG